jgi:hypothetical protein
MILMLSEPRSGTSEQAKRHGLSKERFEMLPMIERFAWNWAILNEKAIKGRAAIDTVKVLRPRYICERPIQEARALFRFTGSLLDQQTEDFIARSTTFLGRNRYCQVFRDTSASLDHWRTELSLDDRWWILAVARKTTCLSLH